MPIQSSITSSEFRELCLSLLERASWSLKARVPGRNPGLDVARHPDKRRHEILKCREDAGREMNGVFDRIDDVFAKLFHSGPEFQAASLLGEVGRLAKALETLEPQATLPPDDDSLFRVVPEGGRYLIQFTSSDLASPRFLSLTESEWKGLSAPQRFLAAVTEMCAAWRSQNQPWFPAPDLLALERAAQLIERGIALPRVFCPILTSTLRPYQTYLSLADPGPGHLEETVRSADLLAGTIVHIEYIDRGRITEKSVTEAYRIPSIRHAARIRLTIGDTTPCSVYIGRPTFESRRFENDLLKSAHTIAAACSAMFGLGLAECKIAMDGMTARQCIEFMCAVTGNTLRDRSTQRLSAAFNLNPDPEHPFLDDRLENHAAQTVPAGLKLAELAVELAKKGQFDKVTWDGAGDGHSQPIIGQLSPVEFLDLVHRAHRAGLETYISAGMNAEHMHTATCIGIGGVGIGTSLHDRNATTGAIGRLLPDKVRTVLNSRNAAAASPAGKAADCLAKLDWLYSELAGRTGLENVVEQIRLAGDELHLALRDYLAQESPSERINRESRLTELTLRQSADGILAVTPPPDAWQPYRHVLGPAKRAAEGGATSPAGPQTHPLMNRARAMLAAFARELEIRAVNTLPAIAPLGSDDRFEQLKGLVEDGDLAGIQMWLQD